MLLLFKIFNIRFKKKKEPRSLISIIKSNLDSIVENIMNCKINLTLDMRINAPLIVVIISDKASDIVTIDLGFIHMKSGKIRKLCNSNYVKESYYSSKLNQSSHTTGHTSDNDNNNNNNNNDNDNNTNNNNNNNNNSNNNNSNNNISHNNSYDDDDYSVSGARYTVSSDDKEYGNDISNNDESTYHVTSISLSEIEVSLLSITKSKDCYIKNNIYQNQNQYQNNQNNQNNYNNMTNLNNFMRRSRLIEKFDVNIEVQLSDEPWGASSCTPIRLFIDLPKISIRCVHLCVCVCEVGCVCVCVCVCV